MASIDEDIKESIHKLLQHHQMHVVDERYVAEAFGDYLLEACSDAISLRIIRDRGEWYIDVKRVNANRWLHLPAIAEMLGTTTIGYQTPIERSICFVEQHFDEIVAVLSE